MENFEEFESLRQQVDSIEIVGDLFIPDGKPFIIENREMALAKKVYAKIVVMVGKNLTEDPKKFAMLGALVGVYDSRVWLYRRKPGLSLSLEEELHICHIGLTANPKCEAAFENLRYFLKDCKDQTVIDKERDFCNMLTARSARNALLWRHRVWMAKQFGTGAADYKWVVNWTSEHPADSSAFYFMENIMPTDRNTLIEALQENTKAIFNLPGHESIWHHRRFLLQKLIKDFTLPGDWKQVSAPTEDFDFPVLRTDAEITNSYTDVCDDLAIDINMILVRSDASISEPKLDLSIEDVIVAIARSDKYPVEYDKQMRAAEKHFKWLRCVFMKMF